MGQYAPESALFSKFSWESMHPDPTSMNSPKWPDQIKFSSDEPELAKKLILKLGQKFARPLYILFTLLVLNFIFLPVINSWVNCTSTGCHVLDLIDLVPNKPLILCFCRTSLLKKLWEKEKLLVTSNL